MNLLSLATIVFLCNLAPIFAPPTWSIIVYFLITRELNPAAAVISAALAAGTGRYLLAIGTRALRNYIPIKARKNLYDAGVVLEAHPGRRYGTIALFILSPLPSAQLFEAAGLMQMNLKRLTLAFFSGRIFTYSIYASGAYSIKATNFGHLLTDAFKSPYSWALQLFSIAIIYWLAKVDWRKFIQPTSHGPVE